MSYRRAIWKTVLILAGALLAIGMSVAYWWYSTTPQVVAERWIQCGANQKSLVSARDAEYWDEAKAFSYDNTLSLLDDACLSKRSVSTVELNGTTALVVIKEKWRELSWKEMTEFPAAATKAEKLSLLRDRAEKATKIIEQDTKLTLSFEPFSWRVVLGLEKSVPLERRFKVADDHRQKGAFREAVAVYDSLLANDETDQRARKRAIAARLAALGEMACATAARNQLKFPEASEYKLRGHLESTDSTKVRVWGDVLAPNAFGVKGTYTTSCDVTFPTAKSKAVVDLLMISVGDLAGSVRKTGLEISI